MGNALPYDAEIEYLESTGTSFIDLGVQFELPITIDANIYLPYYNYGISSVLCGGSLNGTRFWVCSFTPNYPNYVNCALVNNSISTLTVPKEEFFNLNVDFQNGKQLLKINGTVYVNKTNTTSVNPPTTTVKLLIASFTNTQFPPLRARLGKFNITIGATNFELIPVRVGQVGYMYDKVSGQLFGNSGTGDFILGNDVN